MKIIFLFYFLLWASTPLADRTLFTQIRPTVPYQAWNYTWKIFAHDSTEVLSVSKITSAIWLPSPQVVDAARLGQGSSLTPYGRVRIQGNSVTGPHPDIIQPWADSEFFVCRNRQDVYCGQKNRDLFCKRWGCEETGSAYWLKSIDYSHIPLKVCWNFTKSRCSMQQPFCSPIRFEFTSPSPVSESLWMRGITWGLRFHHSTWPGFSFRIQLFKEPLHFHEPIAVGPNSVLVRRPYHALVPYTPHNASHNASHVANNSSHVFYNAFQISNDSLPGAAYNEILGLDGSFWALLNATATTGLKEDPELMQDCWMCASARPPFYQAFAIDVSFYYANDSRVCRWNSRTPLSMTVLEVAGAGLCLTTNHALTRNWTVCNATVVPETSHQYIVPPGYGWWACKTGLTPCIFTEMFMNRSDVCVLVQLIPKFSLYPNDDFLELWSPSDNLHRSKREPFVAVTLAVVLGLSAAGAGTGISSLALQNQKFAELSRVMDANVKEMQQQIEDITDSLASLAEVVLQNRRGLDLLLLQQGGLCAALQEECCVYVDKTGLVRESIKRVREGLEQRKRERDREESWYENWFSTSPWITTLLPSILGPLVGLLLLVSFGPWLISRLTTFIKQQIENVTRPVMIHYHALSQADAETASVDGLIRA